MHLMFIGTVWTNTKWRKCYSRLERIGLVGRIHASQSAKLTAGDFYG